MKSSSLVSASHYALALLSVGLWSSNAGAQPLGRDSLPTIAAPAVQEVAPLGVKAATDATAEGIAPLGIGAVAPVAVNASAYRVAAAIKKLRAGEMTPQQAWESKALDVDDLIYFLEKGLDDWGGFFWEKDNELRRALVALLVEHGGEKLKQLEELAPAVRLWLADYYGSIKDARVLLLSESILSEMKEPLKGENAIGYQAVERIAWFYKDTGQYEKAAKEWMRIDQIHKDSGWWGPHAMLEAAWTYAQGDGNEAKAEEAYKKVASYNIPWATHTALWGLARLLIKEDRHKEVREILKSQLQGDDLEQRQVTISSLMADSFYRNGEFRLAREWSQKALSQYEGLSEVEPKMGTDAAISESSERLWWIEQWKVSSLVCWPPQLDISSQEQQDSVFNIRSFREVPVTITVDDPRLRTTLKGKWQSAENGFCFDQEITVELLQRAAKDRFSATVTVTSPRFPGLKQKVRVQINQVPTSDKGGN